ncbi:hypothetical protein [Roseibacillus persicicus]|uniref:hypothetical protein n=1 Tax=Roseibacillus persicicus TaxID=454148 RepID=UPI00280ED5F7|nr:hypothetical protein [Roseibacillus persicicus]MDQ8192648.1 hypothetical protein [Roseibacillus persicicus]
MPAKSYSNFSRIFILLLSFFIIPSSAQANNEIASDDEIAKILDVILRAEGMDEYASLFLQFPKEIDMLSSVAADIVAIKNGAKPDQVPYKYRPYKLSKSWAIGMTTHKELINSKMPELGIFAIIRGQKVPISTAQLIGDAFANGFVTHYYLSNYVKPIVDSFGDTPPLNISINIKNHDLFTDDLFHEPDAFKATNYPTADKILERIDALNLNSRIELAGILLGWQASLSLEEKKEENPDAYKAIHSLIDARHNYYTLGRAVSYSLTVLQAAESIMTAVSTGSANLKPEERPNETVNFTNVLKTFREKNVSVNYNEIVDSSDLATLCYELTLGGLQRTTISSEEGRNKLDFATGFLDGAQIVSSEVMNSALIGGFQAGYAKGEKDGWEAGMEAGRLAGIEEGTADGHRAGLDAVRELKNQLKNLKKERGKNFFGGMAYGFTSVFFTGSF